MRPSAPPGFNIISEGLANVIVPAGNKVFYNNVQEFNRDLSICVLTNFANLRTKELEEKGKKWFQNRLTQYEKDVKNHAALEKPVESSIPARFVYPGLRLFEAFAASGLRSIRYFKEIPKVDSIHVNDMDPAAVASIRRNIRWNQIPEDRVIANQNECTSVMYNNRATVRELLRDFKPSKLDAQIIPPAGAVVSEENAWLYSDPQNDPKPNSLVKEVAIPNLWDAIDLDPYGSVAPYLDSALQAVESGGILCITSTDSDVLCGNYHETCYAKYGSAPLKGTNCHEASLRVLLHTVQDVATRQQRMIEPLLSVAVDFYVRIFVRVHSSALQSKFAASNTGITYTCVKCGTVNTQRIGKDNIEDKATATQAQLQKAKYGAENLNHDRYCEFCNGVLKFGGPFWFGPLHSKPFVQQCLTHVKQNEKLFGTSQRIKGILETCYNELDIPFSFSTSYMSNYLHSETPRAQMLCSALKNAGYNVSLSHTEAGTLKTNAPNQFIWDMMKAFVATNDAHTPRTLVYSTKAGLVPLGVTLEDGSKFEPAVEEHPVEHETLMQLRAKGVNQPGELILSQPAQSHINFTYVENAVKKVPTFLVNPEKYWGPKAAAGIFAKDVTVGEDGVINFSAAMAQDLHDKSVKNQGTKKRKAEEQVVTEQE